MQYDHPDYYAFDILSDLLSNGRSSRLNQRFGTTETIIFEYRCLYFRQCRCGGYSILVVNLGRCHPGTGGSGSAGRTGTVAARIGDEQELEKVKNKFESTQIFGNINYLNVATNLAWFELLGRAEDMEKEVERYRAVTAGQLQKVAQSAFRKENGVILYYKKQIS